AVRTLDGNGYYEVVNWGVGVGDWRVRAVFSAQGDYAGSESEYKTFSIQPVPTNAYLTLDGTLNGQPGYVSVHGNVQRTNGAPASGTVNVNFQKWNGSSWVTQNTATPTLVNGGYDINYREAGVGQWRVRAVFPAQGDYAQSESEYHSFQIKSGYRLVSRHSGKCLSLSANNGASGTPIIQWDCSGAPNPGDGQVFTLVPIDGNGQFFYLKINSTGKCVDVTAANPSDGAYLQEWDCIGGQTNQHWQIVPISGQPPYEALIARHSGKCMDVLGLATGNGARIGQWGCWWGGNQQWYWQAID
ncbi:MAG TPA: RICIN domain-containing protein, partial [Conexibacter sp.]|nr:RICIN domain-containing protein [Conexibacter sp.]